MALRIEKLSDSVWALLSDTTVVAEVSNQRQNGSANARRRAR